MYKEMLKAIRVVVRRLEEIYNAPKLLLLCTNDSVFFPVKGTHNSRHRGSIGIVMTNYFYIKINDIASSAMYLF